MVHLKSFNFNCMGGYIGINMIPDRDFDLSLTRNFYKDYQRFIIDTTKPLPDGYMRCYEGFVSNVYVQIGRTSYKANGIDEPDFACFRFRNTLEPVNRLITIPVKYTISNDYNKPYYQFEISDFINRLPAEFTNLLLNERNITKARTSTNFSRLIAGCVDRLVAEVNGEIEQLKVHHYDVNSLNDVWHNLIPVTGIEHKYWFHPHECIDNAVSQATAAGLYSNTASSWHPFSDKFMSKLAYVMYPNKERMIFAHDNKRNYSCQFNDDVMFAAHYLKHIRGLKGRDFDKIGKEYNGIELPSGRTMRTYLKHSPYREFEAYYAYITGDETKLSTIQDLNQNITFEKYPD